MDFYRIDHYAKPDELSAVEYCSLDGTGRIFAGGFVHIDLDFDVVESGDVISVLNRALEQSKQPGLPFADDPPCVVELRKKIVFGEEVVIEHRPRATT